jgi:hypothetical protein
MFDEPGPFNPPKNAQSGTRGRRVDLSDATLPLPRLAPNSQSGELLVPAYTDLKLHDGLFTTIREAVLAHSGEALSERRAFELLSNSGQKAVLDFLGSLQVLPAGTRSTIVDEHFAPRSWAP